MIKKLLLALSLVFSTSVVKAAELNFYRLQESVYKVYKMREDGSPYMVASSFAVNSGGQTYLITNNHVCLSLAGPGGSYVKIVNGPSKNIARDYDPIVSVYVMPRSDVCVAQTLHRHPGLTLAEHSAGFQQKITVFGYLGRSEFSMTNDGRLYGDEKVSEYAGMMSCKDNPPSGGSINYFICLRHDRYPKFKDSTIFLSTLNVGPGFSGSPVLNEYGEVVGIIARYAPPSKMYGNGDGLYYDVAYIKKALSEKQLIPVDDKNFAEDSHLIETSLKFSEVMYNIEYFFKYYIFGYSEW